MLSACKVSLTQGRYTFRHDQVLMSLESYIKEFIATRAGEPFPRCKEYSFY